MKKIDTGVFLALFTGLIVISSCQKLDNNIPQTPAAWVKVVHAAPYTTALDIAFDRDRLGLNFFAYTTHTNYIAVTTGINAFYVFKGASNIPSVSKNLNFEQGKFYSVFVADTGSKMDAVLLKDSTRASGNDSVRLRFANMSPDAGPLDLYVTGSEKPLATRIAFKSAGDFISMKVANNVKFDVTRSGQNKPIASSVTTNLVVGNVYTIYATGFLSGTTDDGKLRVERITHRN